MLTLFTALQSQPALMSILTMSRLPTMAAIRIGFMPNCLKKHIMIKLDILFLCFYYLVGRLNITFGVNQQRDNVGIFVDDRPVNGRPLHLQQK